MSVEQSWDRIEAWLDTFGPGYDCLRPPASDEDLAALESAVDRPLPDDFVASYRRHNGQVANSNVPGLLNGMHLLSLRRIEEQHNAWRGMEHEVDGQFSIDLVRQQYACAGWVPLCHDWGGNHLGLDLDPLPGGKVGQVIVFGRDEPIKYAVEPSMEALLARIADYLDMAARAGDEDRAHYLVEEVRWLGAEREAELTQARRWIEIGSLELPRARNKADLVGIAALSAEAAAIGQALFPPGHPNRNRFGGSALG